MLESRIQAKIIKNLREAGIYYEKPISNNLKGVPDIRICYRGRFVAFEVKRPGCKPTELQEFKIDEIRKSGGIAEVVYEWGDVAKILGDLDG